MKKIAVIFIISLLFTFFPLKTYASNDFSTTYDVTYNVLDSGITHVVFGIGLKNKTSNYYASSYGIELDLDNIENIKASDPDGPITPNVIKTDRGSKISLNFNKKVLGLGNTLNFTLSFDTNNIAYKQGQIWEVNIPGVAPNNDFYSFSAHVKVPASFGKPFFIKPDTGSSSLNFTKEQLGKSGISISFGDNQKYSFTLRYHLKNKNFFPIRTEIALPPSTNYQDVYISDIFPKPLNVTEDRDGNWLAQYRLLPSQASTIMVRGLVNVFLYPKKESLTPQQFSSYLKETKYWQVSDKKIKDLARSLKTPEAIYNYVVKTLTYDFSRVSGNKPRLGALGVLQNNTSAVCLEFTDLFIALSRAAGIPAREVDGYANTQNSKQRPLSLVKDILHAWPEYYDNQTQSWIMVDPTWGNTTSGIDYFNVFDFDHIAFVVKGLDSEYPIPAGGYKLPGDENIKDVEVQFTDSSGSNIQEFEIQSDIPQKALSATTIKGTVTLKNVGQSVLDPQNVSVLSYNINPKSQNISFPKIPPFGSLSLPITFEKTPLLTNRKAVVTIRTANREISSTINISPFYITREVLIGGVIGVIFIALIYFAASKARNLPIFRRKK